MNELVSLRMIRKGDEVIWKSTHLKACSGVFKDKDTTVHGMVDRFDSKQPRWSAVLSTLRMRSARREKDANGRAFAEGELRAFAGCHRATAYGEGGRNPDGKKEGVKVVKERFEGTGHRGASGFYTWGPKNAVSANGGLEEVEESEIQFAAKFEVPNLQPQASKAWRELHFWSF
ncbi:hypothetical protein N7509_013700 [Penicillium cosmopolitanum]|uniref:Uncharacterized protein n=1 Tax=Penicillium cosmopolitanum TaxID=1131564 RepID=A0A9W9SFT1_9EURO|nr:uncharacterized protein N7509_013700 [Penicillium cosmopolitanum]KAJ5376814.1 hypothetical protein N7509_013700 [Penicillium cosmopolitanum]